MNKTGPQLLELSPQEGFSIQEKYVAADALYSQIKEDVKKRAQTLDEAISQSTQVTLFLRQAIQFPHPRIWLSYVSILKVYYRLIRIVTYQMT